MARHKWDPTWPPPRDLVRPVPIDPAGITGPTRGQAAGPLWRRTSQGYYLAASVTDKIPEQRILEQSVRLPQGAAVTAWASCRASGANFFDGLEPDGITRIPVPFAVGRNGRLQQDRHASVGREPLGPDEVVMRFGVPCTRDQRALFDEMRRTRNWREAVVAMDMMAAAGRVSISRMRAYYAAHPDWRRARQVDRALDHANEHSASPTETRMRLIWEIDAGLPPPLVNQEVFTLDGRLLGVADLLDPIAGVVGEYDGADHRGAMRHSKDVAREELFRRIGCEYFKVTGPDLPNRPLVRARMDSTRSRAKFLPPGSRRWTLEPPPGWPREKSLDERLDSRDWLEESTPRGT